MNLISNFFYRADAKISVLLGFDIAMVGTLFALVPAMSRPNYIVLAIMAIFLLLVGASIVNLYRASYPVTTGGDRSLIYFNDIKDLPVEHFISRAETQTTEQLVGDLLQQVHRNSQILSLKFDYLRLAHVFLLAALPFWAFALGYSIYLRESAHAPPPAIPFVSSTPTPR